MQHLFPTLVQISQVKLYSLLQKDLVKFLIKELCFAWVGVMAGWELGYDKFDRLESWLGGS